MSVEEIHEELEKKIGIEAPPQSACNVDLARKIKAAVDGKQSIVERLKGHTAFENPEILGQLVQYVEIEEHGTNFEEEKFLDYKALGELQNQYLAQISRKTNSVTGSQEVQFTKSNSTVIEGDAEPSRKKKK
jgi:HCNGP-like protein